MANGNELEKQRKLLQMARRFGFSKREAQWIVEHDLDYGDDAVRKLFRRRNTEVRMVMGFLKASRPVAIREVAKARLAEAKRLGVDDPWDVWVGGSP